MATAGNRKCIIEEKLLSSLSCFGKFIDGWIAAEDFCQREAEVRRDSAVPGSLLFVWECVVALLRE